MKYLMLAAFALMLFTTSTATLAESPSPELKAILMRSNDITPGDTLQEGTAAVPAIVRAKIIALASSTYEAYKKNCVTKYCDESPSSFYGPIFRLKAVNGKNLYVFETIGEFGGISYFFMLFDPKTGTITKNPPSIYARWFDMFYGDRNGLLKRPFIYFSKIGNKDVLIAEDYAHNGDMYNAAIYRYFCVRKNLALIPILAVEERALWPFEKGGSTNMLIRKLRLLNKRTAEINVYLQSLENKKEGHLVGRIILKTPAPCEPYHISKIIPFDREFAKFSDALITVSETDKNKFIVTGDNLFY